MQWILLTHQESIAKLQKPKKNKNWNAGHIPNVIDRQSNGVGEYVLDEINRDIIHALVHVKTILFIPDNTTGVQRLSPRLWILKGEDLE